MDLRSLAATSAAQTHIPGCTMFYIVHVKIFSNFISTNIVLISKCTVF